MCAEQYPVRPDGLLVLTKAALASLIFSEGRYRVIYAQISPQGLFIVFQDFYVGA